MALLMCVEMQGGMDLAPHLYVLPLELTPFQEVVAALGAQEAFSAAQYTTVLQVRLLFGYRTVLLKASSNIGARC